jgi:hypothetical protein
MNSSRRYRDAGITFDTSGSFLYVRVTGRTHAQDDLTGERQ